MFPIRRGLSIARRLWLGVRLGLIDPDSCGIPGDRGIDVVRCNVVRDLAALNKVELLAWDIWGLPVHLFGKNLTTEAADIRTDKVAEAIARASDVARLQAFFAEDGFRVPRFIVRVLDTGPVMVELDHDERFALRPSG